MLNFDFLEKSVGMVSPAHFVYDFSGKMTFMLHSITWPNFIVLLPFLLDILGYMCVAIIYLPVCDVMKFEINLVFLIKLLFSQDQKVKTNI